MELPQTDIVREHETFFRVRYSECDQQGVVHHSRYLIYFEQGRIELLRASGYDYGKMEELGILVVVAHMDIHYMSPARYDDELRLVTRVTKVSYAKIEHEYQLYRGETLLVKAKSKLAAVNREGKIMSIPPEFGGLGEFPQEL
ncbi:MAG: thioesterase family protein [Thermoguttaceae bacterium]|nr:thioesterase family protein [Thermoguttaceae bacterium]